MISEEKLFSNINTKNSTVKKVDFVMTPTVPVLPFKIGEKIDDPVLIKFMNSLAKEFSVKK